MTDFGTHPSDSDLIAFAQGKLSPVALRGIDAHLQSCPACCSRLQDLETGDEFEAMVKKVGRDNLPDPAARHSDVSDTVTHPTGPSRSTPGAGIGDVIARRYTLREVLGEGGMGTVYRAEQTDPVRRDVALKLIKVGMGSKSVLARFEAERQAIALMDHPHIARMYDAGTDAGTPYFVMELVKGVPISDFCDRHRLGVRDRLALFGQVCGAVQHAHQKGVIHRDLKPSNVLVESHDGRPVPKVIDFGLAKATGGLQLTENTQFTGFGAMLGTPLYMAPEQATFNAVDVDTRADVYALGVILYELLTGSTPIDKKQLGKAAFEELLRVIREDEPPTPSSRLSTGDGTPSAAAVRDTEPAKLGRLVKGELDWVVMKALAKDRDRRYDSAAGFARDVERFLNHEPVAAGPPSAGYRVRKFVRRHRGPVVAAGLLMVALVAGLAGTGWQWRRAVAALAGETAERARVTEALRRERQTRDRMLDSARRQSLQLTRLAVMSEADVDKEDADKVLDDFRRLWADVLADAGPGPEADRLRADYDLYMGTFRLNLSDLPAARDHLRRAVAYWRTRSTDAPDELRPAGEAYMRLAMALPTTWYGLNPLPLDGPDNCTGTGLAGLAGPAAVAADHVRRVAAVRPEVEGLLREGVSARRAVAATGGRADRAALADSLGTAADMTADPAARQQWGADELAELLALTADGGGVTDWCARIDCRGRMARQAADRRAADQVRAAVAAAEADYEQAIKTFGSVGTHRVGLRLCLNTAEVMLAIGDHKAAAAAADVYPKFDDTAWGWRKAADWLAGCSRLAAADRPAADGYARRAVDCLGKAIDRAPGMAPRLFDDAEYDPIRDTPEFRRLKERVTAKPPGPP